MVTKSPTKIKQVERVEIKQPHFDPGPFDGYNKDLPIQTALGGERGSKKFEAGYFESVAKASDGRPKWRFTPLGVEFADADGFPDGSIPISAIANIAANSLLGNIGGAGAVETITLGAGLAFSGASLVSTITQYTDEMAQDAVGTILLDGNTINFTYNDGTPSITGEVITQMSITADASGIKLSGDAATPGNSKYYGTNGSGTKGWYSLPSAPGGSTFATYAAGTAYSLTNAYAALNFGTTDPAITITTAGTYMLFARVRVDYTGATFAANRNVSLKIRRTNNTAADVSNSIAGFQTGILVTETSTADVVHLPVCIYTTANTDDALEIQGKIDTVPSAGSIDAVEAELIAVRIA